MIRVLVVDDSAVVRRVLHTRLSQVPDIEVVGTAPDPYVARDKILALDPDVLTLDLEMPRMDGLTFLHKLMRYHPMPIIVLSSLTAEGSETAVRALELGAVEVVGKPGSAFTVEEVCDELIEHVRVAARAHVREKSKERTTTRLTATPALRHTTARVIVIGASTGGTRAISEVLGALPRTTPGTLIVQHMPEEFTTAFARRLDEQCEMQVREARHGDLLTSGLALIAPGNRHLTVARNGARYKAQLRDGPPVHYQRPAVDVLFQAAARHCGPNCVAALLTGMGQDGARGLLALRKAGAHTIAQDEESCVVYGMPRAAVELNAVDEVRSLDEIAEALLTAAADDVKQQASA